LSSARIGPIPRELPESAISGSSQGSLALLSAGVPTLLAMNRFSVATPLPRAFRGARREVRPVVRSLRLPQPELLGLLVLSGVLNLWALSQNGWANQYYSAAVRSMASSWHAFLYGSFDAAGVMTVDKPPLALWVQALSVKVFGYHPLSMLVPEALMGVATVWLVYDLVRRRFGRVGGFVAGLVLATTPIAVAISRHNNPDALLILCCVAALWFVVRGLEDGRTRWLVLAGVAVGLGFEAKMAVALMVVPGIAAAWLWVAPHGAEAAASEATRRLRAVGQLLAGGLAMVVVGGAWPLLMWLTPAADRPWISGTSDNSIWSLILDYNGFGRLDGQLGGPGGMAGGGAGGGGGFGGGGPGGGVFGGSPGWLRLLDSSMGGQAGWLLGFALVGGLAILFASRLRRGDARTGWLLAVGGAALTSAVAFSTAKGIFHPYYVSFLAPFVAALVGGGFAQLVSGSVSMRVWAPLAIAAGVATELIVLHNNPGELAWVPAVIVIVGAGAAAALATTRAARWRRTALGVALAALLLAPATWATQTLGHATNGTFPAGGPASAGFGGPGGGGRGGGFGGPPAGARQGGFGPGGSTQGGVAPGGTAQSGPSAGGFTPGGTTQGGPSAGGTSQGGGLGGGPFGDSAGLTEAIAYARQHGGGTIAVSSQTSASSPIIVSGANVAAIGGFSGRESEVSVSWLAEQVRAGRIRWVLTSGDGGFGGQDGRVGATKVMSAVQKAGREVTSVSGLYDLSGRADALLAAG
jgi:4-amino-4-deoxy-L-arabinose transferase-like glycosyltransferase